MSNRTFKKAPGKSRSPINWQDKTHVRSGTRVQTGREKFQISEVKPETQIHKLLRSMQKVERKIKKLAEEKNKAGVKPERRAECEAKIVKLDSIYNWKLTRKLLLERKAQTNVKRVQTRIENERKASENKKEYIEKKVRTESKPDESLKENQGFHAEPLKSFEVSQKFKRKKIIKSGRGGRKVVTFKHKRFDNK